MTKLFDAPPSVSYRALGLLGRKLRDLAFVNLFVLLCPQRAGR